MKPLFILIGLLLLVGCKHESATITDTEAAPSLQIEALHWLIDEEDKIGYPNEESRNTFHDSLFRQLNRMRGG